MNPLEETLNKILDVLQTLPKGQDEISTIEKVTAKNCYDITHLKAIK